MFQKYFKVVFWFGYLATTLVAFLPIVGNLSKLQNYAYIYSVN